jgi:hypothetical protein
MADDEEDSSLDEESVELIETLVDNEEAILENRSGVIANFEENVGTEDLVDVFVTLGSGLDKTLRLSIEDDDERTDVINGLYRILLNYDSGAGDVLFEKSDNSEFISLITLLSSRFTRKFRQKANRQSRGRQWWSDVKTNIGLRSGEFYLENELTIDMEHIVTFTSALTGQVTLSDHFVEQISRSKNEFGEEVLESVNKEAVERLSENVEELLEDMNQYEEEYDVDLSGTTYVGEEDEEAETQNDS